MADETSAAEARKQTSEVAHKLNDALSQVTITESSEAIQLKEVLRTADAVAAQTGTYYSAMVAVLVGDQLFAAGIGRSALRVQRADNVDELIRPTTQGPTQERDKSALLKAALGIGFSDMYIQTCDTNLEALDSALLMIEPIYPRELPFRHTAWRPQSPGTFLDHLYSQPFAGVSVAVVVGCSFEDNRVSTRDEA